MSFGVFAQKESRIIKAICRKTKWKKESIEIGSIKTVTRKVSRGDMVRSLNSSIGMPKGFGQTFTIPADSQTVYYVVYYAKGIPFGMCFDKYYKPLWDKPVLL
jgi:hypothetical protein